MYWLRVYVTSNNDLRRNFRWLFITEWREQLVGVNRGQRREEAKQSALRDKKLATLNSRYYRYKTEKESFASREILIRAI